MDFTTATGHANDAAQGLNTATGAADGISQGITTGIDNAVQGLATAGEHTDALGFENALAGLATALENISAQAMGILQFIFDFITMLFGG